MANPEFIDIKLGQSEFEVFNIINKNNQTLNEIFSNMDDSASSVAMGLESLQNEVKTLTSRTDTLRSDVDGILTFVENNNFVTRDEIDGILQNVDLSDITSRIGSLETASEEHASGIALLTETDTGLRKDLDDLKATIDSKDFFTTEEINAIKEGVSSLGSQIVDINSNIENVNGILTSLETSNQELSNTISAHEEELIAVKEALEEKVSITGSIVPGMIIMAGENGELICSNKSFEGVTFATTNLIAANTRSVIVENSGANSVAKPYGVGKNYAVYLNGKLLIQDTHYTVKDTYIELIDFVTYKDDMFTFVIYAELEENDQVATEDSLGMVKSSSGINKITVEEDGTMKISKLYVSSLVNEDGTEFILSCGNSI